MPSCEPSLILPRNRYSSRNSCSAPWTRGTPNGTKWPSWATRRIPGPDHCSGRVHAAYRPNKVVAQAERPGMPGAERLPLLAARDMIDGMPTAYVCRNYSCERPVTCPRELFAMS